MAKLEKGQKLPDFIYNTPFQENIRFSEVAKKTPKTALVFLRYYGCTLCQYDIHNLAKNYKQIVSGGNQFLIVLQSDPKIISEQITPSDLPFDIICDPVQTLYKKFEIKPAPSKRALADFRTATKITKALLAGHKHGAYEGDELQLPAVFVVTDSLELSFVQYGKSAGDVPTADELTDLLK